MCFYLSFNIIYSFKILFQLIKELQSEQKYTLADEMLRILTVSQRFKNEIHKEQAKIELLNDKVVEANERTEVVTKLSETDHKTIEILKLEIGIESRTYFEIYVL